MQTHEPHRIRHIAATQYHKRQQKKRPSDDSQILIYATRKTNKNISTEREKYICCKTSLIVLNLQYRFNVGLCGWMIGWNLFATLTNNTRRISNDGSPLKPWPNYFALHFIGCLPILSPYPENLMVHEIRFLLRGDYWRQERANQFLFIGILKRYPIGLKYISL
jgi:hypothetical protein